MLNETMMREFEMMLEEKEIIEYVRNVMDLKIVDDSTVPLMYTKTYGILSPNIVQDLITKGVIIVIRHNTTEDKIAA
jgi:hypothetical protein